MTRDSILRTRGESSDFKYYIYLSNGKMMPSKVKPSEGEIYTEDVKLYRQWLADRSKDMSQARRKLGNLYGRRVLSVSEKNKLDKEY